MDEKINKYKVPKVIAEIGTSHNGDIRLAKKLIDGIVEVGCKYIKTQYIIADEILHANTGLVNLPSGSVDLYNRFKDLERPIEFYKEMKDYCEEKGAEFICSAFGVESAKKLVSLGVEYIKIASPELNHYPLLDYLNTTDTKLIISTGVSKLQDIAEALEYITRPVTLMHCVVAYPTPEEEYNLRIVENLRNIFGVPVGVSDHSKHSKLVPLVSGLFGATLIEKHVTLDKEGGGLDDSFAITMQELEGLMEELDFAGSFASVKSCYYFLCKHYGKDVIDAIIGTGYKKLAESEKTNYGKTNRSIHVTRQVEIGEYLTEKNTAILRTEKGLKPGLHPRYYSTILGKKVTKGISSGEGVAWEDLLQD